MEKKPRGRPPIENPATETIPRVRVTPEQLQSYRDAADSKAESFSEWLRRNLDKAVKRDLK